MANARIVDVSATGELEHAMEMLSAEQVTDDLNEMLQSNTELLDNEAAAEFLRLFGGGAIVDGEYVPIANEKLRRALRIVIGGESL